MEQVWYACYGSNLKAERFNCYIAGGRPKGSIGMESAGSIDQTPPSESTATFVTDWQLYFAREFIGWGGKGVAFLQTKLKLTIIRCENRKTRLNPAHFVGSIKFRLSNLSMSFCKKMAAGLADSELTTEP